MYHVVSLGNRQLYESAVESWYRLRYRTYVEEMGWKEVARADSRECDQFDLPDTVHLLNLCDRSGDVVAGARINTSLAPTLSSTVFAHLCNLEPLPTGPTIADGTRFCVAKEKRDGTGFCLEARELYAAVMEFCVSEGLTTLTFVAHTQWIGRFAHVGWRLRLLGTPQPCEGKPTVAAAITIDEETLARTRAAVNVDYDVLIRKGPQSPLTDLRLPFAQGGADA